MLSLKLSLLPAFIMAIIVSAQKIIYNVKIDEIILLSCFPCQVYI